TLVEEAAPPTVIRTGDVQDAAGDVERPVGGGAVEFEDGADVAADGDGGVFGTGTQSVAVRNAQDAAFQSDAVAAGQAGCVDEIADVEGVVAGPDQRADAALGGNDEV